jgi:RND family efflux transporter MFP subunit
MRHPTRALAAALSIGLALSACGRAPGPAPAADRPAAAPDTAAPSRLVEPQRVRHAARVTVTGTLKARQSAALAMGVPGTLAAVTVRRGQEVRQGTLLASLDDGAAAAAVKQGEAGVSAARAQLALAEDAFARVARIREQEGMSEAQLVQARAQRDLAAAQLAGALAQLDQARVHLAHHHLRAPFPGVVTRVPDGLGIAVRRAPPS